MAQPTYPVHYPPPPAGSLSPVAMGAIDCADDSSERPALRLSTKPSRGVGIALLAIGAILGTTVSVVQRTHHRHEAMDAAVLIAPAAKPPTPSPEEPPTRAPVANDESTDDAAIELEDMALEFAASKTTAHNVAPKSTKRTKAPRSSAAKAAPKAKEAPAPKPVVAKEPPKEAPKRVEAPAPSPPPAAPSRKLDDAANLLKAAKGATENTL